MPRGEQRPVTLIDVARECGCSVGTVSMVLNNTPLSGKLAHATRERVQSAAKRLGYRPNSYARSLRRKRSDIVGVVTFDITDPFCARILRGIEQELAGASYLPMIMDVHGDEERFRHCVEVLLDRRAEGLIVVANWLPLDLNTLTRFAKDLPIMVAGREYEHAHISSVATDNSAGAAAAFDHLYQLGHRDIAVLRGPMRLLDSSRRWKAVQTRAAQLDVSLSPELMFDLPDSLDANFCFEAAYTATKSLLAARRRFTAIHAFDDLSALGCMRALAENGIRIPRQCSVVGFDDIPQAAQNFPSLTTVRQPMETLGRTCAKTVLTEIGTEKDRGGPLLLAPELVIRESTGSVAAASA
jgi:LacI family transcriptional regulator, galactose operon repressor